VGFRNQANILGFILHIAGFNSGYSKGNSQRKINGFKPQILKSEGEKCQKKKKRKEKERERKKERK
jgi:hypothetical protein